MNEKCPTYRNDRKSPFEEPKDRGQPCSSSLVEEYLDGIISPLSMLAAHQGDGKISHKTMVTPFMLEYVTDPESHTECLRRQRIVDQTPDLCFSKPTDTVRGTAGSDMTNSAHSSLSSSCHDLRTDIPLLFDQAIVQGMAAWTEEHCNSESHRHRPVDLEPENEVEAEIMAARALQACGMIPQQVHAPRNN